MRPENENVPGGSLGRSRQQAEKLTDTADDSSSDSEYRVVWRRQSWTTSRDRMLQQENAAHKLIRTLRRNHPRWPALREIVLERWTSGWWGAWLIHASPADDAPTHATDGHRASVADELTLRQEEGG